MYFFAARGFVSYDFIFLTTVGIDVWAGVMRPESCVRRSVICFSLSLSVSSPFVPSYFAKHLARAQT